MPAQVNSVAVPTTANETFALTEWQDRRRVAVFNDTPGDLYVKLGPGASSASFSARLVPGALLELDVAFAGLTAACAAVTGRVHVTEVTA